MCPLARGSKQIRRRFALGASLRLIGAVLLAAERISLPPETSGFRPGPGAAIAVAQCLLCHSADYVSTQPRLPRNSWKATLQKMRDKYGAPLPEDKVEVLLDYLAKTYGAEAPR